MSDEWMELPDGWEWTTLGEAFSIFVGATPSRKIPEYWGGSIPWVSSGEVAFCEIHETRETITELGLQNTSTEVHPPGTVLLGMIGEGKTRGQVAILKINAAHNQNSAAIRVSEVGLIPKYVYHFLEQEYERTRQVGSGNNQPALNKSRVQAMVFPLAPLNEQKRIVAKIEELRERSQNARSQLSAIPELCDRFRQSVLAAAFRGDLTADWRDQNPDVEPASVLLERIRDEVISTQGEKSSSKKQQQQDPDEELTNKTFSDLPNGWKLTQIRHFCISSFYGPRFSQNEYVSDGIPSIRTTDMTDDGEIILKDPPRLNIPESRLEDFRLQPMDLLVTRSGSIGMMAVFRGGYVAIPSAYLIRFRFSLLVDVDYVFHFLKSPIGQTLLGLGSTAVTQANINAEAIKNIPIPLPSLEEQKEIVVRIQVLLEKIAQLRQQYQGTKTLIDQLDRSILAKAFRGELVEQDPNDEPASVLLERIRAEREQLGQSGKTSRKTNRKTKP